MRNKIVAAALAISLALISPATQSMGSGRPEANPAAAASSNSNSASGNSNSPNNAAAGNSNAGGNSNRPGSSQPTASPEPSVSSAAGNSGNSQGGGTENKPVESPASASPGQSGAVGGGTDNKPVDKPATGGGNSATGTPPIDAGPISEPPASSPNADSVDSRAAKANSEAKEKAEEAAAARQAAEDARRDADRAAAARREAEAAVRNAEKAAEAALAAAAKAAAAALAEARDKAAKAAAEARAKAEDANRATRAATAARSAADDAAGSAKAMEKIKGATDSCLGAVEGSADSGSSGCESATYVIRFSNGVDPELQASGMRAVKIPVSQVFGGIFSGAVAQLNAGQLRAVLASDRVRSVEQDFVIRLAATQTDPTWGLDRLDQLDLPLSRTFTNSQQGAGVRAYVVDTGVLPSHVDFGARVTPGFTAISDGRGTIDCNGHGTHVAGTLGGSSFGVAKAVQLVPVRVLDCSGSGLLSGVVAGLDWIAKNHPVGTPGVANLSLGGGVSSTLDAAVENLVGKGVPVVVAAGNSAADACNTSPARTPGAITVAASNVSDGFAFFSNWGSCVDLVAPGVEVVSAWYTSNTATASLQGTSMAAPHVAGLVASLQSAGYLTPGQIDFELKSKSSAGRISGVPSGTANLLAQLSAPAPVVEAPVSESPVVEEPVSESPVVEAPEEQNPPPSATVPISPFLTGITTQRNAVRVNWQISPDGGSPLLEHIVRIWEGGLLTRSTSVSSSATTTRIGGLKWGVSYTFTVIAVNALGRSQDSNVSVAYTPKR